MQRLLRKIKQVDGSTSIEGAYVIMIMLAFVLAFYAIGSFMWSQTVLKTSATLSAQSGIVAADRYMFADGVLTPAEQNQRAEEAKIRAKAAAQITFNSMRRNPQLLEVLNINPNKSCNGIVFADAGQNPQVTTNNTPSGFEVQIATAADWQVGPDALFHRCLSSTVNAKVAVK